MTTCRIENMKTSFKLIYKQNKYYKRFVSLQYKVIVIIQKNITNLMGKWAKTVNSTEN